MTKKLTAGFTAFSLVLCLFNYLGFDPDDIFFFMLSNPVWIIETFYDIHYVNVYLVYLLTVLSYALLGYIGDYFLNRGRSRRRYRY